MEEAKSLNSTPEARDCDPQDHEAKRDERHLRHWIVKVFVLCLAFMFVITSGSVMYVYVVNGGDMNNELIDTFVRTTTEIIKFMTAPSDAG